MVRMYRDWEPYNDVRVKVKEAMRIQYHYAATYQALQLTRYLYNLQFKDIRK